MFRDRDKRKEKKSPEKLKFVWPWGLGLESTDKFCREAVEVPHHATANPTHVIQLTHFLLYTLQNSTLLQPSLSQQIKPTIFYYRYRINS